MSKRLLAALGLGTGLTVAGIVLLVCIIRAHAVNIISAPPAPAHTQSSPTPAKTAQVVSSQSTSPSDESSATGMPKRIIIPDINVNLPVIPGYYDTATGQWTLTKTNVQFATSTAEPNDQAGNTFIYGHALNGLFGSLPKLHVGATAIVETDNGHAFFYTLASTKVVDPSDSGAVLNYSGKPILTLQTCVGLVYQSRELLTFNLQRVS